MTLRIQNDTKQSVGALEVSYVVYIRNDQERGNRHNYSYSADESTYTSVLILDLTSAATSDALGLVSNTKATTLSGLSIVGGGVFYLRWSGADVDGSGFRDEFVLDDIFITAVPEPAEWGLICVVGLLGVYGLDTWRERRCTLRQFSIAS